MLSCTRTWRILAPVLLLLLGLVPALAQAPGEQTLEAEKCSLVPHDKLTITDEAQAGDGKYVTVPEGQEGLLLIETVLQKPAPGRYHGVLRFR